MADAAEIDPLIGAIVADRFSVLASMGRGTSSRVYRALQLATDREFALKIVARTPGAEAKARFEREAKAMARLRSPYTAIIYDAGELDADRWFIAMELVHGETLEALLTREGKLPAARAIELVIQLSHALEEAHQLGIIHRDLKPSNIMIEDRDGKTTAKLIDFGLAKSMHDDLLAVNLSVAGLMYGTPAYMAPEQWSEDFGALSPATDVYALGEALFEMLTGSRVFRAHGAARLMREHLEERPPRLPSPPHDQQTSAAIERCLMKSPADRFESMAAFRKALTTQTDPPRAERRSYVLPVCLSAGLAVLAFFALKTSPATIAAPPLPLRVTPARVIGALAKERDQVVLRELDQAVEACMTDAKLEEPARLHVVLSSRGEAQNAELSPAVAGKEAFLRCIQPALAKKTLEPTGSRFVAITWELVLDPSTRDTQDP